MKPLSKHIFTLVVIFSMQISAQKINFKGKLLDAKTKEAIVYANISFLDSNKGISSNEDGTFSMNLPEKLLESKVHISCLNYKDTILLAKEFFNKILYLKSTSFKLDEIVLTKRVENTAVLGEVKNRVQGIHTSGMRMLAKYFPNDKRSNCCNYISKLEIFFSKRSQHQKQSKFRIRIFNKDKKTGLPKDDILNVNLPVEIKEEQLKVVIDVSAYNLKLPENGVFIAFEKLFIPFNQYGKNESDTENEFFYSPMIGFTKYNKKNRNKNFYFYVKGKWQLSPLSKVRSMNKYAPAISLTLSN